MIKYLLKSLKCVCFQEGRWRDSRMLADSRLLPLLEHHALSPAGMAVPVSVGSAYLL